MPSRGVLKMMVPELPAIDTMKLDLTCDISMGNNIPTLMPREHIWKMGLEMCFEECGQHEGEQNRPHAVDIFRCRH